MEKNQSRMQRKRKPKLNIKRVAIVGAAAILLLGGITYMLFFRKANSKIPAFNEIVTILDETDKKELIESEKATSKKFRDDAQVANKKKDAPQLNTMLIDVKTFATQVKERLENASIFFEPMTVTENFLGYLIDDTALYGVSMDKLTEIEKVSEVTTFFNDPVTNKLYRIKLDKLKENGIENVTPIGVNGKLLIVSGNEAATLPSVEVKTIDDNAVAVAQSTAIIGNNDVEYKDESTFISLINAPIDLVNDDNIYAYFEVKNNQATKLDTSYKITSARSHSVSSSNSVVIGDKYYITSGEGIYEQTNGVVSYLGFNFRLTPISNLITDHTSIFGIVHDINNREHIALNVWDADWNSTEEIPLKYDATMDSESQLLNELPQTRISFVGDDIVILQMNHIWNEDFSTIVGKKIKVSTYNVKTKELKEGAKIEHNAPLSFTTDTKNITAY